MIEDLLFKTTIKIYYKRPMYDDSKSKNRAIAVYVLFFIFLTLLVATNIIGQHSTCVHFILTVFILIFLFFRFFYKYLKCIPDSIISTR